MHYYYYWLYALVAYYLLRRYDIPTEEIAFEIGHFCKFHTSVTLTLTLDLLIQQQHTVVYHSSTSTYIPEFRSNRKHFCERTDGRTNERTEGVFIRSTRRSLPTKGDITSQRIIGDVRVFIFSVKSRSRITLDCTSWMEPSPFVILPCLHGEAVLWQCAGRGRPRPGRGQNQQCPQTPTVHTLPDYTSLHTSLNFFLNRLTANKHYDKID